MGADADRNQIFWLDGAGRVLAVLGLLGYLRVRVDNRGSLDGRASSISGVRFTIQMGLPRHFTRSKAPGSSFEMSASTGAPAARALALGFIEAMKGTAAKPAPMAPTTLVATTRIRRLFLSAPVALALISD
jgi:hypothetical protein